MIQPKQETFRMLRYFELEDLVKSIFGHEYSFQADVEAGNDTQHAFSRITKERAAKDLDVERAVQEFIETGRYSFLANDLLLALVERDILPEGSYLISIDY